MPLNEILDRCLPGQGCIEIQRDAPGREHAWHQHETDETIVVLDGRLWFFCEGWEVVCKRGDVILLPKGTRHGSRARDGAVTYLIAFHLVEIQA